MILTGQIWRTERLTLTGRDFLFVFCFAYMFLIQWKQGAIYAYKSTYLDMLNRLYQILHLQHLQVNE